MPAVLTKPYPHERLQSCACNAILQYVLQCTSVLMYAHDTITLKLSFARTILKQSIFFKTCSCRLLSVSTHKYAL